MASITNELFAAYGAMLDGRPVTDFAALDLTVFNEQVATELRKLKSPDAAAVWAVSSLIWHNMYGWKKAKGQSDAVNAAGINPMYVNVKDFLKMPQAFGHLEHVVDALESKTLAGKVDPRLLEQFKVLIELGQTRVSQTREGNIERIEAHNALVLSQKPGLIPDHKKGKDEMSLLNNRIGIPVGLAEADVARLEALPALIEQAKALGIDPALHLQPSLLYAEVEGCTSSFCCFDYVMDGKKPSTVDKCNVFCAKDGEIYVLVIMRKNAQGIWCWALPGGFVDHKDFTDALALLNTKGWAITKENLDAATTALAAKRELDEEVEQKCPTLLDPRVVANPEKFFQLDNTTFELVSELSITKVRPFWEARLMFMYKEMTVGANISIYNEVSSIAL